MSRDRSIGIRVRWLVAVVALGACDAGQTAADAADTAAGALTCPQLMDALRARIAAAGQACGTVGDCALVGTAADRTGFPGCSEAIAYANQCWGDGVNRAAWEADAEAAALQHEWYARCVPLGAASGITSYYDCSPGALACTAGQCTSRPTSCFGTDAGVQ